MPRYLIYAQDQFGTPASKTGNSVIRYSAAHVAAVLDASRAGRTSQEVIGHGGDIPVVASVDEGVRLGADSLLVGIAVAGGGLPAALHDVIRRSLELGLDVWNGLHGFVGDDPELAAIAKRSGATIHDVRRPPADLPVGSGRVRELDQTVFLAVGTDANIGKMTVMLQLRAALRERGVRAGFAPTGQTGIFIEGWGMCVDAVVADFIAGASEAVTIQAARDNDIVLVEGQGSILHPGYSGVSLGLLHGSLPHGLIACHQPSRSTFRHNAWLHIPPLTDVIALHEAIANPLRQVRTIAVSLNTADLSDRDARAIIDQTARETGLPTTDPVRYDIAPLAHAVLEFDRERRASSNGQARRPSPAESASTA
jgi:D-glutamate N-acetyltransferase